MIGYFFLIIGILLAGAFLYYQFINQRDIDSSRGKFLMIGILFLFIGGFLLFWDLADPLPLVDESQVPLKIEGIKPIPIPEDDPPPPEPKRKSSPARK